MPQCAFHTISINVKGPIKHSTKANTGKYIIAAVELFTKRAKAQVLYLPTVKATATFMCLNIISKHGCLQIILKDNGTKEKAS